MSVGNVDLGAAKSDENAERTAMEPSSGCDKAVLVDMGTAGRRPHDYYAYTICFVHFSFFKHTLTIY